MEKDGEFIKKAAAVDKMVMTSSVISLSSSESDSIKEEDDDCENKAE